MAQTDSLCTKCSLINITCCREHDIYVTMGDIRRIGTFMQQQDFHEFRKCPDDTYMDWDDPVWTLHVFRSDGRRRVLKTDGRGRCIFLTDAGCLLPMEMRPLICRLHPYRYNAKGINGIETRECPVHLLKKGQQISEAIGLNRQRADEWHRMLYKEIIEED